MSCATNITAYRNADLQITYAFPSDFNFTGHNVRMQVRASEGAVPALIDVALIPNANGSYFTFIGPAMKLLVRKADLEALPSGTPVADPWVGEYDIILTDATGVESYFVGGFFTVLEGVTR